MGGRVSESKRREVERAKSGTTALHHIIEHLERQVRDLLAELQEWKQIAADASEEAAIERVRRIEVERRAKP